MKDNTIISIIQEALTAAPTGRRGWAFAPGLPHRMESTCGGRIYHTVWKTLYDSLCACENGNSLAWAIEKIGKLNIVTRITNQTRR